MIPKRTSPSIVTTAISVPFTQTIQGTNAVSVPTPSDVELQPQVVAIDVPMYPNFCLPDMMNWKLRQVMYATSNVQTPDSN